MLSCCCSKFLSAQTTIDSAVSIIDTAARGNHFGKNFYSFSMDILGFYRNLQFRQKEHEINFNNRVASLDNSDYGIYFRPSIDLKFKGISLAIQPRLNTEYNQVDGKYELKDLYLQKAKLDIQLSTKIKASAGRYFKTIGTSLITNPSNLFFVETNSINPKIELMPQDFVEVAFNAGKNLNINLIANLAKGEDNYNRAPYFGFKRQYGIQIDHYSNSFQLGALLSSDESGRSGIGLYGQKNVGSSLVFWIDAALKYNPNRFYPRSPEKKEIRELINYEMVNGLENRKLFIQGLLGMSYTFSFGPTLNFEYYYNSMGYKSEHLNSYWKMIYQSSDYNFDITTELSKKNMGRAINPGMQFIRNNYLLTQFGQNDVFDQLNFFVRYFHCLDDNSQQISALAEWNILDRLELFSTVLVNPLSGKKGDFNRLVSSQLMFGLIYRL